MVITRKIRKKEINYGNNFKKIALFRSFYGIEGFEIPNLFKDKIKEKNEIPINIQLANLIEDLPINTDIQPFYEQFCS